MRRSIVGCGEPTVVKSRIRSRSLSLNLQWHGDNKPSFRPYCRRSTRIALDVTQDSRRECGVGVRYPLARGPYVEGVNNMSPKERERRLAKQRVDRSHRGCSGSQASSPCMDEGRKGCARPEPSLHLRSYDIRRRAAHALAPSFVGARLSQDGRRGKLKREKAAAQRVTPEG
jgi:hypothetical protein